MDYKTNVIFEKWCKSLSSDRKQSFIKQVEAVYMGKLEPDCVERFIRRMRSIPQVRLEKIKFEDMSNIAFYGKGAGRTNSSCEVKKNIELKINDEIICNIHEESNNPNHSDVLTTNKKPASGKSAYNMPEHILEPNVSDNESISSMATIAFPNLITYTEEQYPLNTLYKKKKDDLPSHYVSIKAYVNPICKNEFVKNWVNTVDVQNNLDINLDYTNRVSKIFKNKTDSTIKENSTERNCKVSGAKIEDINNIKTEGNKENKSKNSSIKRKCLREKFRELFDDDLLNNESNENTSLKMKSKSPCKDKISLGKRLEKGKLKKSKDIIAKIIDEKQPMDCSELQTQNESLLHDPDWDKDCSIEILDNNNDIVLRNENKNIHVKVKEEKNKTSAEYSILHGILCKKSPRKVSTQRYISDVSGDNIDECAILSKPNESKDMKLSEENLINLPPRELSSTANQICNKRRKLEDGSVGINCLGINCSIQKREAMSCDITDMGHYIRRNMETETKPMSTIAEKGSSKVQSDKNTAYTNLIRVPVNALYDTHNINSEQSITHEASLRDKENQPRNPNSIKSSNAESDDNVSKSNTKIPNQEISFSEISTLRQNVQTCTNIQNETIRPRTDTDSNVTNILDVVSNMANENAKELVAYDPLQCLENSSTDVVKNGDRNALNVSEVLKPSGEISMQESQTKRTENKPVCNIIIECSPENLEKFSLTMVDTLDAIPFEDDDNTYHGWTGADEIASHFPPENSKDGAPNHCTENYFPFYDENIKLTNFVNYDTSTNTCNGSESFINTAGNNHVEEIVRPSSESSTDPIKLVENTDLISANCINYNEPNNTCNTPKTSMNKSKNKIVDCLSHNVNNYPIIRLGTDSTKDADAELPHSGNANIATTLQSGLHSYTGITKNQIDLRKRHTINPLVQNSTANDIVVKRSAITTSKEIITATKNVQSSDNLIQQVPNMTISHEKTLSRVSQNVSICGCKVLNLESRNLKSQSLIETNNSSYPNAIPFQGQIENKTKEMPAKRGVGSIRVRSYASLAAAINSDKKNNKATSDTEGSRIILEEDESELYKDVVFNCFTIDTCNELLGDYMNNYNKFFRSKSSGILELRYRICVLDYKVLQFHRLTRMYKAINYISEKYKIAIATIIKNNNFIKMVLHNVKAFWNKSIQLPNNTSIILLFDKLQKHFQNLDKQSTPSTDGDFHNNEISNNSLKPNDGNLPAENELLNSISNNSLQSEEVENRAPQSSRETMPTVSNQNLQIQNCNTERYNMMTMQNVCPIPNSQPESTNEMAKFCEPNSSNFTSSTLSEERRNEFTSPKVVRNNNNFHHKERTINSFKPHNSNLPAADDSLNRVSINNFQGVGVENRVQSGYYPQFDIKSSRESIQTVSNQNLQIQNCNTGTHNMPAIKNLYSIPNCQPGSTINKLTKLCETNSTHFTSFTAGERSKNVTPPKANRSYRKPKKKSITKPQNNAAPMNLNYSSNNCVPSRMCNENYSSTVPRFLNLYGSSAMQYNSCNFGCVQSQPFIHNANTQSNQTVLSSGGASPLIPCGLDNPLNIRYVQSVCNPADSRPLIAQNYHHMPSINTIEPTSFLNRVQTNFNFTNNFKDTRSTLLGRFPNQHSDRNSIDQMTNISLSSNYNNINTRTVDSFPLKEPAKQSENADQQVKMNARSQVLHINDDAMFTHSTKKLIKSKKPNSIKADLQRSSNVKGSNTLVKAVDSLQINISANNSQKVDDTLINIVADGHKTNQSDNILNTTVLSKHIIQSNNDPSPDTVLPVVVLQTANSTNEKMDQNSTADKTDFLRIFEDFQRQNELPTPSTANINNTKIDDLMDTEIPSEPKDKSYRKNKGISEILVPSKYDYHNNGYEIVDEDKYEAEISTNNYLTQLDKDTADTESKVEEEQTQEEEDCVIFCTVCDDIAQLQCGNCKMTCYCSISCQRNHWDSGHNNVCLKSTSKV